jgi:WD40-like Beta Propeller Repeat
MLSGVIVIALCGSAVLPATPASDAATVDASKLTFSTPSQVVELDTKKLDGEVYKLSWSPDGQQLYLQTVEKDKNGRVKTMHHYLLPLSAKAANKAEIEPAWSNTYWMWKSGQAAPGVPALKVELEEQQKKMTAAATPMGGDLAKGGVEGGGTVSAGAAAAGVSDAAMQSQTAHYYILKVKGEVVGEFVNTVGVPGLTFGWGPNGTGLIAYGNHDGHLVVMDDQGRKQEVQGTKSVVLPAWTDDGKKIAFFEKIGRNKVTLKTVDVTQPGQ